MTDALVIGAGVVGLTSALALQQAGRQVTIWTREPTARTTSAVAAAIWLPFLAEPRARVLPWARRSFELLRQWAADPHSGIAMTRMLEVRSLADPEPWWASIVDRVEHVERSELPFGDAAIAATVPICDTTRFLPWLLQRFHDHGGVLEQRTVHGFGEAFARADDVVNCSGLGARALCNDHDLRAIRGQVLVLPRQGVDEAWIDDTGAEPFYALPRSDDVVLGGTAQIDDERTEPAGDDTEAILAACRQRLPALAQLPVRAVKVGLRPGRTAVRLELERPAPGRRLVHNYGHGGSGFTLAPGCAEQVVALLTAAG